jgi:hypothetical protein
MAAHASGSTTAPKYAPNPFPSAWTKTATTGRQTNRTRKARATLMRIHRITRGSLVARTSSAPILTIAPWLTGVMLPGAAGSTTGAS